MQYYSPVTVVDVDEEDEKFCKLTGFEVADPAEGKIAAYSPVAEALLDHSVGDIIEIKVVRGILKYKIIAINR